MHLKQYYYYYQTVLLQGCHTWKRDSYIGGFIKKCQLCDELLAGYQSLTVSSDEYFVKHLERFIKISCYLQNLLCVGVIGVDESQAALCRAQWLS